MAISASFQFFKKGTRAYTLRVEQDLLGDWVVRRTWGPLSSPFSRQKIEVFLSQREAELRFESLVHFRQYRRQYLSCPLKRF